MSVLCEGFLRFYVPSLQSRYRIVLLSFQVGYVLHLFGSNAEFAIAAANVGSHFIINNLLQTAFVLFWVRSYFRIAEVMLILNWFNLTSLYFRHSTTPRFVHMPVVSAPLAWTFVAIFWNGAVMVDAQNLAAKVTANVFVWSILIYGMFFLAAFRDYSIGFQLSMLSAGKSNIYHVREKPLCRTSCIQANRIR